MAAGSILIRGGRVVDPSTGTDRTADVLVEAGRIARVGDLAGVAADERIDATGCVVTPGWIDMHVHLREPGFEEKETIRSGAAAAVAGGVTAVACMPNTNPPIDTEATVEYILLQAERAALARVYPVAAITRGRAGEALSEMGRLRRAGAVAFSDDGAPVSDAGLMRRAMEYARMVGCPVISHCEDRSLRGSGVMHEGVVSARLGLAGIPSVAEDVMVLRDLELARVTGGRLHIAHVSTAGAVEAVRRAKARGVHVTAEAAPHHMTLTDEALETYDPDYRMYPPLRAASDVAAVLEGVVDGTIDAIATDHAPHTIQEKETAFPDAPDGVVGLETLLGIVCETLVHTGRLPWPQVVERVSCAPARILGIPGGTLAPGASADVTVIDPARAWVVEPAAFRSLSRNTPFAGRRLRGRAVCTLVGGRKVFAEPGRP